jgi:diguanylate cyclase (GGDEF)-like protein
MEAPRIPDDEERRMAALRATELLFTPAEERFDRITRLAARHLDTPIALVSLIADHCQWFKSAHGLAAPETSREISFCGHAIHSDDTFVVANALDDPRFADNPLVTGDPKIRFYAGHPLHTADGSRAGTLCIIDQRPRQLTAVQLQALRDLAAIAESELQRGQLSAVQAQLLLEMDDLKRRASIDGLTRLWNRSAIMDILAAELGRAKRGAPLCVAMIDADYFKKVNDLYGHPAGDAVLVELAARIRCGAREYDAVGRYGGEEFIAVLTNCERAAALAVCERIRARIEAEPIPTPAGELKVTVSIGLATYDDQHADKDSLVATADAALYRAKHKGRNRVES